MQPDDENDDFPFAPVGYLLLFLIVALTLTIYYS